MSIDNSESLLTQIAASLDRMSSVYGGSDRTYAPVGFPDDTSLYQLKRLFDKYFKESNALQEKQIEALNGNIVKTNGILHHTTSTEGIIRGTLEKFDRANNDQKASIAELIGQQKDLIRTFNNMSRNIMRQSKNADDRIVAMSSAGVNLVDSINSFDVKFTEYANNAGLSLDDFAKSVVKNSKYINHLTSVSGNGIQTLSELMNSYKDIKGLTRQESSAIVDMQAKSVNRFGTVISRTEDDAIRRNRELSSSFMRLKEVFGTSIETLTKYNEMQEQNIRLEILKNKSPVAYAALKEMGLTEDQIQYVLSGKMTASMAASMSNPVYAKFFNSLRQSGIDLTSGKINERAFTEQIVSVADSPEIKKQRERDSKYVESQPWMAYLESGSAADKFWKNKFLTNLNAETIKSNQKQRDDVNDHIQKRQEFELSLDVAKNVYNLALTVPPQLRYLTYTLAGMAVPIITSIGLNIASGIRWLSILGPISTYAAKALHVTGPVLNTIGGIKNILTIWFPKLGSLMAKLSFSKLSGGGGGMLGDLLSMLIGRGKYKVLGRVLGGAASLGISAYSAYDLYKNSDKHKQEGTYYQGWGSTIGGVLGSGAGLFFGPAGAVIGGMAGSALGNWIGSKFDESSKENASSKSSSSSTENSPYNTYGMQDDEVTRLLKNHLVPDVRTIKTTLLKILEIQESLDGRNRYSTINTFSR